MRPILAIVHFTRTAIEPIQKVFGPRLGEDAEILHFLDEAVFFHTLRHGPKSTAVLERVQSLLTSAAKSGAWMIVSSGSSLSPAVDFVSDQVKVPVLKIEAALAAEAVKRFQQVAVVVTKGSNVEPFKNLLDKLSQGYGRHLHVRFDVQEEAFAALLSNDPDLHDKIVLETIATVARRGPDAILLPQVSIARVMSRLPADLEVPVLSSVHLSVDEVVKVFGANRTTFPSGSRHAARPCP